MSDWITEYAEREWYSAAFMSAKDLEACLRDFDTKRLSMTHEPHITPSRHDLERMNTEAALSRALQLLAEREQEVERLQLALNQSETACGHLSADYGEAREMIRQLEDRLRAARGGCKILSQGDQCDCGLCKRDREIGRLQAELAELRQALHAINFMQRCNVVVDGGSMMLNVDSPFFDTLVFAEPVSSVTWLNTIKHVKSQRDECRRLLRIISTEYKTNAQHPGTHPVASEWCLVEESWLLAARAAGGDDVGPRSTDTKGATNEPEIHGHT